MPAPRDRRALGDALAARDASSGSRHARRSAVAASGSGTRAGRLDRLALALEHGASLRLRDAAALLDVSEMTVRRDLAASGDAFRYLGGHILRQTPGTRDRYDIDAERTTHLRGKVAASAHAAALVEDGDAIFVDCGTTLPHLVRRIPESFRLTVVCYSLEVAAILAARPRVRLILLGGLYHPTSASFASDENLALLARVGINKAFISAAGVHPTRGVSCMHFHEVPVKQAAMASAMTRHLVVDASKFGRVKPAVFAKADAFDTIVTDANAVGAGSAHASLRKRLVVAPAASATRRNRTA